MSDKKKKAWQKFCDKAKLYTRQNMQEAPLSKDIDPRYLEAEEEFKDAYYANKYSK